MRRARITRCGLFVCTRPYAMRGATAHGQRGSDPAHCTGMTIDDAKELLRKGAATLEQALVPDAPNGGFLDAARMRAAHELRLSRMRQYQQYAEQELARAQAAERAALHAACICAALVVIVLALVAFRTAQHKRGRAPRAAESLGWRLATVIGLVLAPCVAVGAYAAAGALGYQTETSLIVGANAVLALGAAYLIAEQATGYVLFGTKKR